MNNELPDEDPFPECPPFRKGANLEEKRRFVNEWGRLHAEPWRIRQAKACGAEWMAWLSSGLDDVCSHCQAADGVPIRTEEMDVVAHFAACTNPEGCGCVCIVVDGPKNLS